MARFRTKVQYVEAIQLVDGADLPGLMIPAKSWIVNPSVNGEAIYGNEDFEMMFEPATKPRVRTAKPAATRGRPAGSKNEPKTDETKET